MLKTALTNLANANNFWYEKKQSFKLHILELALMQRCIKMENGLMFSHSNQSGG